MTTKRAVNQHIYELDYIRAISYPLYMLHQFIGFAIIQKIELQGGYSQLWIFVPIVVSVLLAAAVHYTVEVPAAKWLLKRKLFVKKE